MGTHPRPQAGPGDGHGVDLLPLSSCSFPSICRDHPPPPRPLVLLSGGRRRGVGTDGAAGPSSEGTSRVQTLAVRVHKVEHDSDDGRRRHRPE
uniref:Uncharacterized protein n=1 Tax=Aegilops tauschii subsp. strangulata TaxID=200361 RepID=A0A453K1D5_AEGTS